MASPVHVLTVATTRSREQIASELAGVLPARGFTRRETDEPGRIVCIGPGYGSTREDILHAFDVISVTISERSMQVTASLGGLVSLMKQLRVFTWSILGGLGAAALVAAIVTGQHLIVGAAAGGALGVNALLSLALTPVMRRHLERRALRALEMFAGGVAGTPLPSGAHPRGPPGPVPQPG
jgi:hypothetical protein